MRRTISLTCLLIALLAIGAVAGMAVADEASPQQEAITISVDDVEFDDVGDSTTVTIDVTDAYNGVGGWDMELHVDTNVVSIESFEEPELGGGLSNSEIQDDGGTLVLSAALLGDSVEHSDVTIAVVELEATGEGASDLQLTEAYDDVAPVIDQDADPYPYNFQHGEATTAGEDDSDDEVTASFEYSPAEPESGETVEFDASASEADNEIDSYTWDFDDGSTGSGEFVSHSFAAASTYSVSLTVQDVEGNQDTTTESVTVSDEDAEVVADFEYEPDEPVIGEDITFDASGSQGEIVSYDWDLGNGVTRTGEEFTYSYGASGWYDVTLTVEDDAGNADSTTREVRVFEPEPADVTARFEYNPEVPEAGELVSFDGTDSTGENDLVSFDWDFSDGTNTPGEIVSHIFDEPGEYTVSLTVTDDEGYQNTTSKDIDVETEHEELEADFEYSPNVPRAGELITFDTSGSTGTIVEYRWDFDDGTEDVTTSPSASHVYDHEGAYEVTLTVENEQGITDQQTQIISVNGEQEFLHAQLDANFLEVDTEEAVTFDASDSTGEIVEYRFDFGDGNTTETMDSQVAHSYGAPGEYTATLTVEDVLGDTHSTSVDITVIDPDALGAALDVHPESPKVDQQVALDASNSTGNIIEYRWDILGNGEIDDITEGPHAVTTFDAPRTVDISVTVVDPRNRTETATQTITISADPPQAVLNVEPEEVDVGEEVTFDASGSTSTITEYQFDFGDGTENTTDEDTVTHSYDEAADYDVSVTVVDEFGQEATAESSVNVLPEPPSASLTVEPRQAENGTELSLDATESDGDIESFEWEFGDGTTETTTEGSLAYTYAEPDNYTVEVTVVDSAGREDTAEEDIFISAGADDSDGPGFGIVIAVVGLIGAAYLVARRDQ